MSADDRRPANGPAQAPQYMVCSASGVPIITDAVALGEDLVWCKRCRGRRLRDSQHEIKTVTVFARQATSR
jgi:hypothetical protein